MYEWFLSCKKTFRLFLRRIYVNKKSNRERFLTRPLHESDAPATVRPRRSYLPNIVVVSTLIVCYLFFLPSSPAPKISTYSEKSIETAVVFNPRQVLKVHIPKEAKVEFARKWLSRNNPELMDNETEAPLVTFAPTKSFVEQAKDVPANVFLIDNINISSTAARPPTTELPQCLTRVSPENLNIVTSAIKVSLDKIYPMVQNGGHYKPSGCEPIHKVAILVPYRNRTRNLSTFLYNMHPFLMTQNLEYRIFVIEQFGNGKFNKGRLFNAGFKEMLKYGWWRCVVLHDVDLLPLDRRIFYTCPRFPRHMSSKVVNNRYGRNTSSPILFGGVTAMRFEHYVKTNGHSNMYWGWGGEDYDMFWRIKAAMLPITRYNKTIARYIALRHTQEAPNPSRFALLRSAISRRKEDGLSTIYYQVISTTLHHLFTHILVDVQPEEDRRKINKIKGFIKISKQLSKPTKVVVKHRRRDPPNPVKPSSSITFRAKIISPGPTSEPLIAINPPGNFLG